MSQKFETDVATILVAVVAIFLISTLLLGWLFRPEPIESNPTVPVSRPTELSDCLRQVQDSHLDQISTDEAIDNCYRQIH